MTSTDEMLEEQITTVMQLGLAESDPAKAREHFERMGDLIAQRSRRQIRRMELERFGRSF